MDACAPPRRTKQIFYWHHLHFTSLLSTLRMGKFTCRVSVKRKYCKTEVLTQSHYISSDLCVAGCCIRHLGSVNQIHTCIYFRLNQVECEHHLGTPAGGRSLIANRLNSRGGEPCTGDNEQLSDAAVSLASGFTKHRCVELPAPDGCLRDPQALHTAGTAGIAAADA
jgi:hypothetical protein